MGCFSFLCKVSGKPALSTSFDGSPCYLFLLKDGKVVEEMYGNYDSYGRVFNSTGESFEWEMDWCEVCDLMFDESNYGNGIALVLAKYYNGAPPKTRSEQDPDQGWGDYEEGEGYFSSTESDVFEKVESPYHKVY